MAVAPGSGSKGAVRVYGTGLRCGSTVRFYGTGEEPHKTAMAACLHVGGPQAQHFSAWK